MFYPLPRPIEYVYPNIALSTDEVKEIDTNNILPNSLVLVLATSAEVKRFTSEKEIVNAYLLV